MTRYKDWHVTGSNKLKRVANFRNWLQRQESGKLQRLPGYREYQVTKICKSQKLPDYREYQFTTSGQLQRLISYRIWQVTESIKLQRVASYRD